MESNNTEDWKRIELTAEELAGQLYEEFNNIAHPDFGCATWEQLRDNPGHEHLVRGWIAAAELSFERLADEIEVEYEVED